MISYIYSFTKLIILSQIIWPTTTFASSPSPFLPTEFNHNIDSNSRAKLSLSAYSPDVIQLGELQFNLVERSINTINQDPANSFTAITEAQSFNVSHWKNEYLPLLNNIPLKLSGKSLALSISDDESHFIIASDKETVRFSNTGKRVWAYPETIPILATLISIDKKYVITQFSNGSVRWQRYSDGTPVFYLYISKQNRDWIIWSDNGYYDSSSPFFNPLQFKTTNDSRIYSLSQLRYLRFNPEIISSIVADNTDSADQVTNTEIDFPDISFTINSSNNVQACIQSNEQTSFEALIAFNGVTTQRTSVHRASSELELNCPYQFQTVLPRSEQIRKIGIWAVAKKSQLSTPLDEKSIATTSTEAASNNTAVLALNSLNKSADFTSLLNAYHKPVVTMTNLRQLFNTLNKKPVDSFVFYLAARCEIEANEILFLSERENTFLKLSELKNTLQQLSPLRSLIAIDCSVTNNDLKKSQIKKLIHNFIADTGRSFIGHFISREQSQLIKKKKSILQTTLLEALGEEADEDDDLSINSIELINYVEQNLHLKSFEHTGQTGEIYIHKDHLNRFNLPLKIND